MIGRVDVWAGLDTCCSGRQHRLGVANDITSAKMAAPLSLTSASPECGGRKVTAAIFTVGIGPGQEVIGLRDPVVTRLIKDVGPCPLPGTPVVNSSRLPIGVSGDT